MERIGLAGEHEAPCEALLRANIELLMEQRKVSRKELAARLKRSQSWLSKRLGGKSNFKIEDLDTLARAFGLSPADLLQPGLGKWDRRSGNERRGGWDRRRNQFLGSPVPPQKPPEDQFTEG